MKLIVGLGNKGVDYQNTRHNSGFMVIDELVEELGIGNFELKSKLKSQIAKHNSMILAKPQTYMNNSGLAVKKLTDFYKLQTSNLIVVHDDLDLPLGVYKVQFGKGPKDHNGIESVDKTLGTKDYWRIRVGVDNRNKDNEERTKGEDYVLQKFTAQETKTLEQVINNVIDYLFEKEIINK